MSATGLEVFDQTLQKTNLWLKAIMEDLGPDRQRAYHALRAVLHSLRDRLTVEEAAHLSAQLPLLVRGIYFEGWHPAGKPNKDRSIEEFLEHLAVLVLPGLLHHRASPAPGGIRARAAPAPCRSSA